MVGVSWRRTVVHLGARGQLCLAAWYFKFSRHATELCKIVLISLYPSPFFFFCTAPILMWFFHCISLWKKKTKSFCSSENSHTPLLEDSVTQMTPEEHYRRMMSALNEHGTFEEQQQQRLYQLANSMAVPSHGGTGSYRWEKGLTLPLGTSLVRCP